MAAKGIPNTETIWITRKTSSGEIFCITSKDSRDCYYLYKEDNGKFVKVSKDKSPLILEERFIK